MLMNNYKSVALWGNRFWQIAIFCQIPSGEAIKAGVGAGAGAGAIRIKSGAGAGVIRTEALILLYNLAHVISSSCKSRSC